MQHHHITAWTLAIFVSVGFIVTACSESSTSPVADDFMVSDSGYSSFDTTQLRALLSGYPSAAISDTEQRALLFMREKEKLVHDLYASFGVQHNKVMFMNIAQSEQTHAHAVLLLLRRYQVPDPVQGNGPGVFTDTMLQQLHTRLQTVGTTDLVSALLVSAEAEEMDIRDLSYLSARVDNQDILMVFSNLAKGSRNHLRAFVRNLAQVGIRYSPRVLDQATYDAIISTPVERGG